MKLLLFSEDGTNLGGLTTKLREKGEVYGVTLEGQEEKCLEYGLKEIFVLKGKPMGDNTFKALNKIDISKFDRIFISSSPLGRDIAGMIAATLKSTVVTEVFEFEIEGESVKTKRFFFGGKTILEEESKSKVITVQPGSFEPKKIDAKSQVSPMELENSVLSIDQEMEKDRSGTDIESASILVSIGRGVGKKEAIDQIKPLVEAVHGEMSGSRPVCLDYKWLNEERQVGLSGKKVKPRVYIALGISGQIQHIAGMRGSKIVIAVNKDKEAPIFQECDYGIVGDLFQVVPKLVAALKQ
jgi:electron transfer flavoprotein alpha subunit